MKVGRDAVDQGEWKMGSSLLVAMKEKIAERYA